VTKEEIDKLKLESLFAEGKLRVEQFPGLLQQEEKMTIGWPTKMKEGEEEQNV
jgi:hypothetical protein